MKTHEVDAEQVCRNLTVWKARRRKSFKQIGSDMEYTQHYLCSLFSGNSPLTERFAVLFAAIYGEDAAKEVGLPQYLDARRQAAIAQQRRQRTPR